MSDSRVSVGWPLRGRLLLLWGVVLAIMSPIATVSSAQAAAVTSATNVVSVQTPDLVLTESTAIAAETVKAAGTLSGVLSRPIVVQGKSGTGWMTLAEATTSSTGSYATSFSAPTVGSYPVRVVAPKVMVARKMQAEYASDATTLTVVAQSASMSIPATLSQSQTGTATLHFGPVRVGRTVALQVMQGDVWIAMATGQQSSTGTATLTFTNPTPGSYSYRAWTAAANGAPEFASSAAALEVTAAAPGPVTNVAAIPSSTSIALSWNNPADPSLSAVMIRRSVGETPPASAIAGTLVTDAAKPAESFIDTAVTSGTQYSYALFAHDATLLFATAGTVTTTTVGVMPSITGTVTDTGSVPHGLANVRVSVFSPTTGTVTSVTTAGDGTYAVSGLAAGTDYQVWFYPAGATGGSFDALGYLDQAYDNQQPMFGDTPTPVTVTEGATTTAIDAALAVGGAITGTVSDAAGTQHGLAGVSVRVEIPSNGNYHGSAVTAADGSYTVRGMPAGTDYQVCFYASGATDGSSNATGYLDQCFDNRPASGTPTPVAVTLGASRAGVDAALVVGGAVSGTVSEAGGTHQGLANVTVGVYSPSTLGVANATTGADGTYTARGLPAGTDYQVCFYASGATDGSSNATGYLDQCFDNQPVTGTPTPVTVSLGATRVGADAALVAGGAISGTVSDAGGTQHGLANASVEVSSPSTGTFLFATTAADGSYTVSGLAAATDYTVCFHGGGATGGSSDALGYLDQCYDNQPTPATAIPVTVTSGASRTGVNAALTVAGAISGTVRDAGGTHHGLANVGVQVSSLTYGNYGGWATTAADGSYTVTGLAAGTDYTVCFTGAGATGGSSDELGYLDQCYDHQPMSGTPTLVTVTAGATKTAVDAALGTGAP
jgi:Carboxypeptidase regulatory-like domain